ncbi:BnaA06g02740D [Brassica napus]|uniref:BnaA06g02740D protein n=1 Tax=Brassica napus TaxID=3708 RepID=A0A078GDS9_BRANA|nr:BnaA06g02740D [Brassica napus]
MANYTSNFLGRQPKKKTVEEETRQAVPRVRTPCAQWTRVRPKASLLLPEAERSYDGSPPSAETDYFLTTMAAITVDFQLCFIFTFLWLLTRFCLSAFFFKKQKDYDLPPSPPSLPVIGHLHHLLSVPTHKSFHKVSSKYGPLLHLRAFNIPIVLVSSGSMAHEVLSINGLNFATRDREVPIMEKSLLFGSFGFVSAPYGDYWKFMKKLLVTKLLGSHSLERTRLIRGEELKTFRAMLFDKAARNEAVDVGEEMMKLTNNTICRMIMGRKCSEEDGEAEQIRSLVTESHGLVRKFLIASTVGRLLKKVGILLFEKEIMEVSQRYDELLEKIIKEHEENPNQKEDRDMVDVLLDVCADDNAEFKISRNQIKALFVELLLGGTDTSAQTTQWIMAELINHPEILKTLREEIESVVGKTRFVQETDLSNLPYLQAVVKEGLRLHPHSPILVRTAAEGCKIGEFYIPQNTTMIINSYAVMRDPDSWEEPDEFQPERFMVSPSKGKEEMREQLALNYLPFGSGRRGCPGTNLGYIFIGVAVGTMVQCFDWSVNGNKVNMEETGDMTLRMAHPLKCTLVARVHSSASFEPVDG